MEGRGWGELVEPGVGMGAGHQERVWHNGPPGPGRVRVLTEQVLGPSWRPIPWMMEMTQWGACTQG